MPANGKSRSPPLCQGRLIDRNPIAAFATARVFQDAAVLLDGCPRPGIVLITGEQERGYVQVPGNRHRSLERLGCVPAAAGRGAHAVADVPSFSEEEIVQFMPDRQGTDNGIPVSDPQIGARNIAGLARGFGEGLGKKPGNELSESGGVPEILHGPVLAAGSVPVGACEFRCTLQPGGVVFCVRKHEGSHLEMVAVGPAQAAEARRGRTLRCR